MADNAQNGPHPEQLLKGSSLTDNDSAHHRASSPDQVATHLLEGIKSGRYVPGQRLIEADLSESLYVSRGPIREAFKRLAAEGVISLIPHRGAYVRTLTRREVTEVLIIQESLTGLATRLAAENILEGDNRKRLDKAYRELIALRTDSDVTALLDKRARFYECLADISDNSELKRFVPIPQTNLLRTQFIQHLNPADRERQFKDYEQIVEHILNGNGASAESAMRRHIKSTRHMYERLPDYVFASVTAS